MATFIPVRGTKAEVEATPKVDGQILFETDQGKLNRAYIDIGSGANDRKSIGGGGHEMLPDPEETTPTEDSVITSIQGVANSPTNQQVISAYGASQWSNNKIKRFILTSIPANVNTIGTWQENTDPTLWDTSTWWTIPQLYGVLDDNNIEIRISFNVNGGEAIALGGFQVSDAETDQGENVGKICIKFSNHENPCDVAVDLVYSHTEIQTQTYVAPTT